MPRHQRTRWVVVVTANDNGSTVVYGSYYDYDKAQALSQRLAKRSAYYNVGAVEEDDNGIIDEGFTVEVSRLQPFTSMQAFMEGG